MSTPVMPVIPPVNTEAAEANAPEKDSERAEKLRRERDKAIEEGDLPVPDISGISEHQRAVKDKS